MLFFPSDAQPLSSQKCHLGLYYQNETVQFTEVLRPFTEGLSLWSDIFENFYAFRMEMEADYIGLLLIASAGYDPRVAPTVYERLGKVTGESALRDYLSTHPSGKKRAQLLAQAKVMEEALTVYREVIAGRGVEGFL